MTTAQLSVQIRELSEFRKSLDFMTGAGNITQQEADHFFSVELSKLGLNEGDHQLF